MLRLLLLRHAKSSWDDPGLPDRDRPLSPRGRRAAALIAAELNGRGLLPDRILCSPARRARETMAALLPSLADDATVAMTGGLYEPPSGDYLEIVGRRAADARFLMIIGHNPAIQATALSLAAPDDPEREAIAAKLPAGALVVIDCGAKSWADVEPGTGRVALFLRPRDIENDRGFDPGESDD